MAAVSPMGEGDPLSEAMALLEFIAMLEEADDPALNEVLNRPDAVLVKAMVRLIAERFATSMRANRPPAGTSVH
jgi:hypothetical protein